MSTIGVINELNGFGKVEKGKLYYNTICAIRRQLRHVVIQAEPITREMLINIAPLVDPNDGKQLAIWVSILFGFHLFLRKSNLVPETRQHDHYCQLSRADIRYSKGVMVVNIKWSKTNQFGNKPLNLPMVLNTNSSICPVKWCLTLVQKSQGKYFHNLFSFVNDKNEVTPVTYRDLTLQMRAWLTQSGIKDVNKFTSHSLRRGGATHAFKKGVPELSIKNLGGWASTAYKRYIDENVETRLQAWMIFNKDD